MAGGQEGALRAACGSQKVGQIIRQNQETPVQAALDGLRRDAEKLRYFDLTHALDAHQAKHLAFVIGEALNRVQHADGIEAEPGGAACVSRH